ncbi:unnamed protein product [Vitrella brassicaformis CCMP3155]|uniref:FYVE-type domain-containing protein n=1 Tax=Vitrella brassicaformis (strain CCMP3155) TaxID=1169540 RepID=A0A0G4ERK7_VITBC|nr:unnamed protein product [Vitrella brassicaformis CCMP3155]|eukprot:CEM00343.1 unnamed protein product [Vitrella brassicaformis CCMP3155]
MPRAVVIVCRRLWGILVVREWLEERAREVFEGVEVFDRQPAEWGFVMRVIREEKETFQPLRHLLTTTYLPGLCGKSIDETEATIMLLPARYGGTGVRDPTERVAEAYETSIQGTNVLVTAIQHAIPEGKRRADAQAKERFADELAGATSPQCGWMFSSPALAQQYFDELSQKRGAGASAGVLGRIQEASSEAILTPVDGRECLLHGTVLRPSKGMFRREFHRGGLFVCSDCLLLTNALNEFGLYKLEQAFPFNESTFICLHEAVAGTFSGLELSSRQGSAVVCFASHPDRSAWVMFLRRAICEWLTGRPIMSPSELTPLIAHQQVKGTVHYACMIDDVAVLKELIMTHHDVEECDEWGNTPLHMSALSGSLRTLQLLVKVPNLQLDTVNFLYETPILTAARLGRPDLCRLLLRRGASPLLRDATGRSVLHLAALQEDEKVAMSTLKQLKLLRINFNTTNTRPVEPLFASGSSYGSGTGRVEGGVMFPCSRKVSRVVPYQSLTALQACVKAGDITAAERLLRCGADPNVPARDGTYRTVVHFAVESDDKEMVELMLRFGAQPNKVDGYARPPAAMVKSIDVARLLAQYGGRGWKSRGIRGSLASRGIYHLQLEIVERYLDTYRCLSYDPHDPERQQLQWWAVTPLAASPLPDPARVLRQKRCQICAFPFTQPNPRRRCCGRCGLILCVSCCGKRAPLHRGNSPAPPPAISQATSSSSPNVSIWYPVCDGCFNFVRHFTYALPSDTDIRSTLTDQTNDVDGRPEDESLEVPLLHAIQLTRNIKRGRHFMADIPAPKSGKKSRYPTVSVAGSGRIIAQSKTIHLDTVSTPAIFDSSSAAAAGRHRKSHVGGATTKEGRGKSRPSRAKLSTQREGKPAADETNVPRLHKETLSLLRRSRSNDEPARLRPPVSNDGFPALLREAQKLAASASRENDRPSLLKFATDPNPFSSGGPAFSSTSDEQPFHTPKSHIVDHHQQPPPDNVPKDSGMVFRQMPAFSGTPTLPREQGRISGAVILDPSDPSKETIVWEDFHWVETHAVQEGKTVYNEMQPADGGEDEQDEDEYDEDEDEESEVVDSETDEEESQSLPGRSVTVPDDMTPAQHGDGVASAAGVPSSNSRMGIVDSLLSFWKKRDNTGDRKAGS